MKTIKWDYIEPYYNSFGVSGGNYVYHIGKSYFSYNEDPNHNVIDRVLNINTGQETAFYNARRDSFIILLGDFREEITEKNIRTVKSAMEFCKEKCPEYGADMTTDEEFRAF
jgi:hypothetical protein